MAFFSISDLASKKIPVLLIIFIMLSGMSSSRGEVTSSQLKLAIKRGENYLRKKVFSDEYDLSCRSNQGFICPVDGAGSILVMHYIANAFLVDKSVTKELRYTILNKINKESQKPLWGYSSNSPVDADDSSLAMQTLTLLGMKQNIEILSPFYNQKMNAYSTFANQGQSRPVIQPSIANNVGIHPEVNASVNNLLHLQHRDDRINFQLISQFQNKQGYWEGYFYPGKFYSTWLNMRLLCVTRPNARQTKTGLNFIRNAQNKDGSFGKPGNAYETALALNSLLDCSKFSDAKKGIRYLLSQQNHDGAFAANHPIWSYLHSEEPLIIWSAYDEQHVLTTALAVSALKKYEKYLKK